MEAKKRTRQTPLTVIIFFITGAFWIIASLTSESSIHTLGVGLLSLAAGALMLKGLSSGYCWSFYTATSLYNLVLFAYMAYASSYLSNAGLVTQALVSLVGYAVAAMIYLFIVLRAFYKPTYLTSKAE
jgi:di/tricarboxylate transporter